jgi:hypothetical protein
MTAHTNNIHDAGVERKWAKGEFAMMYNMLQYEFAQEQHKDLLREAQKYALVQQALAGASVGRNVWSLVGRMAQLFGRLTGEVPQEFREQRPIRRNPIYLRRNAA